MAEVGQRLRENIKIAVKVDDAVLRDLLVALFAEGHVLIEDYPGVGKTALARALARSIDAEYARVQCTSDLLPTDIVGTNVFNQRETRFEFHPGPVFANVVLVDEINRSSPKTQSGLLECMQERHVTVDGHQHELARPFVVLATQNPAEYEGTYPLPDFRHGGWVQSRNRRHSPIVRVRGYGLGKRGAGGLAEVIPGSRLNARSPGCAPAARPVAAGHPEPAAIHRRAAEGRDRVGRASVSTSRSRTTKSSPGVTWRCLPRA